MFCGFYHEDSLQVFPSMQPVGTAPHQRTIKGLMCFSLISLFCSIYKTSTLFYFQDFHLDQPGLNLT